jgi:hypothetical protein
MQRWETNETADTASKVREALIRQLYKQTWIGLTGVLVVDVLACVALWPVLPHLRLLLWAGVLLLVSIARAALTVLLHRRSPSASDIHRWARLHVTGAAASGLMWALAALFLWPGGSPVHQLVWPISIVALSAAAVAMYSPWTPSYMTFLMLSLVPISARLLYEGGLTYIVLGFLGLFFTGVLVQTGRLMHTASVQALVVGIRNESLCSFLSDGKAEVEELNSQLEAEIAEHRLLQAELRLRNQELERLNTQLLTTKANLEAANNELERALVDIKQLSGMLPICASCKKIRNDKGYWEGIEAYLRDHSEVEFSHGICPDCAERLYPDFFHRPRGA